jgi:hypothetical protein
VNLSPQLRHVVLVDRGRRQRRDFNMPQMFDWIFFAIIGIPAAVVFVAWLIDG